MTGPLLRNPHRVGKALGEGLAGIRSARLGREWRVRYEIDDARRTVTVLDIRHRSKLPTGPGRGPVSAVDDEAGPRRNRRQPTQHEI
ncbi:MAG: type II toxin-antitoxin system RelE family toxin [Carbonactinosporaceae bacterium]